MLKFLIVMKDYIIDMLPSLILGLILSGLIHEFIPTQWVEKHLSGKSIRAVVYASLLGIPLPLCCYGTLPVVVSLYKKGAGLGPLLAFLVSTPATSLPGLLISWALLGWKFTLFLFFSVLLLGLVIGLIGNYIKFKPKEVSEPEPCPHGMEEEKCEVCEKSAKQSLASVLRFSFVDMVKDIGPALVLGLILAALVATVTPIGQLIKATLSGGLGYLFALILGLVMYVCPAGSVPLTHAFFIQGMNIGACLVFLLLGPVTNYGSLLVVRKEFGTKILLVYLAVISLLSLIFGYTFSLVY